MNGPEVMNGPVMVNRLAMVNGSETGSRLEMENDAKTMLSQKRGKVMSGNELRSFKN